MTTQASKTAVHRQVHQAVVAVHKVVVVQVAKIHRQIQEEVDYQKYLNQERESQRTNHQTVHL